MTSTATRSRRCRGSGPTTPGSEEMKEWLAKFAEDRALGKNDASLGIAG